MWSNALPQGFSAVGIGRHLTFVPLAGIHIGPDELQVTVTKEQVHAAPDIETLLRHYPVGCPNQLL